MIIMCRFKWKVVLYTVTIFQIFSLVQASANNKNGVLKSLRQLGAGTSPVSRSPTHDQGHLFKTIENKPESIGFAAEWEYKGVPLDEDDYSSSTTETEIKENPFQNRLYPSRRVGPGSWHDSGENWWLFGGQGPSAKTKEEDQSKTVHFLSDLWVYSPDKELSSSSKNLSTTTVDREYSWKLVFRPDVNSDSPYSSYPENLNFPLLCGSESGKHLALYGAHKNNPRATESHNSPFSEDNVVWLYDIPKAFISEKDFGESGASFSSSSSSPSQTQATGSKSSGDGSNEEGMEKTDCNWSSSSPSSKGCSGTGGETTQQEKQGLWTSYVCCDACLPDGNTTFEFCPQFSRDPISWCSQDSLMMLELLLPVVSSKRQSTTSIKSKENLEKGKSSIYSTSTTTFTSGIFDKNGSPSRDNAEKSDGEERERFSEGMAPTTLQNVASSSFIIKHQIIPKNESIQTHVMLEESASTTPERRRRRSNDGGNYVVGKEKISPGKDAFGNLNSNTKFLKAHQEEQKVVGQERRIRTELTVSKEENGDSMGRRKSEKMKRNGRDLIKDAGEEKNILSDNIGQQSENKTGGNGISSTRSSLNWWKFDLVSTEWIKMPEVSIEGELTDQVQNGDCRAVVSKGSRLVYILCPTKGNLLNRAVLLFNPEVASVQLLGTIHLNNAFTDKKVWQLGRSVLHAIHCDNHTVIFLAYHKLLDLWIHDHSSNRLYSVENVWKGSSLHTFQRLSSFYKLSISLPIPSPSNSIMKAKRNFGKREGINEKAEHGTQKEEKMHSTYSFFMVNPRSKLASFEELYPPAHFHITIVPDREVFLPPRDATYLISSAEFQSEGKSSQNLSSPVHDDVLNVNNSANNIRKDSPVAENEEKKYTRIKQGQTLENAAKTGQILLPLLLSQRAPKGNEPSLSPTVLPGAGSNHPFRDQNEQTKGGNPFNPKSDKKYSQYKKAAVKALPPLLPIQKNFSIQEAGHNGSAQQTSHSSPLIAYDTTTTGFVQDFKSNNHHVVDDDHDDDHVPNFITTTTDPVSEITRTTIPSVQPSSLLSQQKSNKTKDLTNVKYNSDINWPKRKTFPEQKLVGTAGQKRRANTMYASKKRMLEIAKAASIPASISTAIHSPKDNNNNESREGEISSAITPMLEVKQAGSKTEIDISRNVVQQAQATSIKRNNSLIPGVGNLTSNQVQNLSSINSKQLSDSNTDPRKTQGTKDFASYERKTATLASKHMNMATTNINVPLNSKIVAKSWVQAKGSASDIIFDHTRESSNAGLITTPIVTALNSAFKENSRAEAEKNDNGQNKPVTENNKSPSLVMTAKKENFLDIGMDLDKDKNRRRDIMMTRKTNGIFTSGNQVQQNIGAVARGESEAAFNLPAYIKHEVSVNSHDFTTAAEESRPAASVLSPTGGADAQAVSSSHSLFPHGPLASIIPTHLNGNSRTGSLTDDDTGGDRDDVVNVNRPHEQRHYSTKKEESLNRASLEKQPTKKENDQLGIYFHSAKSAVFTWNQPSNLSGSLPEKPNTSGSISTIPSKASGDDGVVVRSQNYSEPRKLGMLQTPEKRATDSVSQAEVSSSAAVTLPVSSQTPSQPQNGESNSDKSVKSSTELIMAGGNFLSTQDIITVQDDQYQSSPFMAAALQQTNSKNIEATQEDDRLSSSRNSSSNSVHEMNQDPLHNNNNQFSSFSSSSQNKNDDADDNNNNNFYVSTSSQQQNKKLEETAEGDVDSELKPMTYGSSEIVVDRRDNILPYGQEGSLAGDTGYDPVIFFAITLSFFASIGVVVFIRRCVKCPPRRESVLIKEPPPMRYSNLPDDLTFHTPIV